MDSALMLGSCAWRSSCKHLIAFILRRSDSFVDVKEFFASRMAYIKAYRKADFVMQRPKIEKAIKPWSWWLEVKMESTAMRKGPMRLRVSMRFASKSNRTLTAVE